MTGSNSSFAAQIVERARAAADRLRQEPYYGRLIEGDVDGDEYVAWLVQMHKYVRHTERLLHTHADSMAALVQKSPEVTPLRASSRNHAREEEGHEDNLLQDIAHLWGIAPEIARGRIEREPTAPSVLEWERLVDVALARFPVGVIGIGLALETLACCIADDTRRNLIERSGIPGIESAVHFLRDHSGENEVHHTAGALLRAELLTSPHDRSAIFFCGNAALTMFEGLVQFVSECVQAKTRTRNQELATAGV